MNSMREVTIAAIQMSCSRDVKENIEKAAKLIRDAAEAGAQIILPSELFETPSRRSPLKTLAQRPG